MIRFLLLLATFSVPADSWLVGGWAPGEAACGSDGAISFEPDGTYSALDGEGVWSLAGQRLTFHSTGGDDFGRREIVQVTARNTAEMELEWRDRTRAKLHRCAPES